MSSSCPLRMLPVEFRISRPMQSNRAVAISEHCSLLAYVESLRAWDKVTRSGVRDECIWISYRSKKSSIFCVRFNAVKIVKRARADGKGSKEEINKMKKKTQQSISSPFPHSFQSSGSANAWKPSIVMKNLLAGAGGKTFLTQQFDEILRLWIVDPFSCSPKIEDLPTLSHSVACVGKWRHKN